MCTRSRIRGLQGEETRLGLGSGLDLGFGFGFEFGLSFGFGFGFECPDTQNPEAASKEECLDLGFGWLWV
jgi:hypothetical protein